MAGGAGTPAGGGAWRWIILAPPPPFERPDMRIPAWTPELKPQPAELVDAILARRGGQLINLDRALLWSEPLARGWNTYLKAVRTVLAAGGSPAELDALARVVARDPRAEARDAALGELEQLVIRYAAQMTLDVRVDDALFKALQGRFDTTALVELTSAIATYNMVARFLVALGVTPED